MLKFCEICLMNEYLSDENYCRTITLIFTGKLNFNLKAF